jgi:hypothetical protein
VKSAILERDVSPRNTEGMLRMIVTDAFLEAAGADIDAPGWEKLRTLIENAGAHRIMNLGKVTGHDDEKRVCLIFFDSANEQKVIDAVKTIRPGQGVQTIHNGPTLLVKHA